MSSKGQRFGQNVRDSAKAIWEGTKENVERKTKMLPSMTVDAMKKVAQTQIATARASLEALKTTMGRWTWALMATAIIVLVACVAIGLFVIGNAAAAERWTTQLHSVSAISAMLAILLFLNAADNTHGKEITMSALRAMILLAIILAGWAIAGWFSVENIFIYADQCKPYFANPGAFNVSSTANPGLYNNYKVCLDANLFAFYSSAYISFFGVFVPTTVMAILCVYLIVKYLGLWNTAQAFVGRGIHVYTAVSKGKDGMAAAKEYDEEIAKHVMGSGNMNHITSGDMGSFVEDVKPILGKDGIEKATDYHTDALKKMEIGSFESI